jgi:aminocarboxymuconate-semialdehyde decarboxylase
MLKMEAGTADQGDDGVGQAPAAIDVHAHAIPPSVAAPGSAWSWHDQPLKRRPDGSLELATSIGRQAIAWSQEAEDIGVRLRYMDEVGVDMQVLSLMPSLWMYDVEGHDSLSAARHSNDDLVEVASQHPRRFRVFAHLPLDRPDDAVAELERMMASDVVVGAGVGTNVAGKNWDEPELFPLLEAAERLGALLFFHPAAGRFNAHLRRHHLRNLIGNPAETTVAIADLIFGGVLDRLPSLRAVFAHGGGYACLAGGRFDHGYRARGDVREHAAELPSSYLRRLYFDNLVHDDAALRYLVDTVGLGQVVLGTDYPADMGPADPVRPLLASPTFDGAEKQAILAGNLAGLIGVDPADIGPASSSGRTAAHHG